MTKIERRIRDLSRELRALLVENAKASIEEHVQEQLRDLFLGSAPRMKAPRKTEANLPELPRTEVRKFEGGRTTGKSWSIPTKVRFPHTDPQVAALQISCNAARLQQHLSCQKLGQQLDPPVGGQAVSYMLGTIQYRNGERKTQIFPRRERVESIARVLGVL